MTKKKKKSNDQKFPFQQMNSDPQFRDLMSHDMTKSQTNRKMNAYRVLTVCLPILYKRLEIYKKAERDFYLRHDTLLRINLYKVCELIR